MGETGAVLAFQMPRVPYNRIVLAKFCAGGLPQNIRATPLFFLGVLMTTMGAYIRWLCYRALGEMFTFEMSIRRDHRLVVDGPYRVVRHPGYTGILMTVTGIIMMYASPVSGSAVRRHGPIKCNFTCRNRGPGNVEFTVQPLDRLLHWHICRWC